MIDLRIIERKLDNGIPVLMVPMRGTGFFTHICAVRAGSRYESPKRNGISHLLEHMMFKGTKRRKTAHEIAVELSDMGASNNAFTNNEFIWFYVDALVEHFARVADIMSDQIINPIMRGSELEKEKLVVFQEMARSESDVGDVLGDMIMPMLYGDQPAGQNTIGTREAVASTTTDKLRYWHRKYFNRNNLVIVVAGNLPPENKALAILNEFYADVPQGERPQMPPLENKKVERVSVAYKDIPQSSFVLAAKSFPFGSPEVPALDLLTTILGKGMSSRLFREVRENRGLAYTVSSSSQQATDTGFTYVSAGTDPSKVGETIMVIRREFANLLEHGISEGELAKAKNMLRSGFSRLSESRSSVASSLAMEFLYSGTFSTPKEEMENRERVTAKEVVGLVPKVFFGPNLQLAVVGPHKGSMKDTLFSSL
ncbi:MAG: pitrilysin family protein [Candidatus Spechtbacterales bacterium]